MNQVEDYKNIKKCALNAYTNKNLSLYPIVNINLDTHNKITVVDVREGNMIAVSGCIIVKQR
jgi:hypothetical protein